MRRVKEGRELLPGDRVEVRSVVGGQRGPLIACDLVLDVTDGVLRLLSTPGRFRLADHEVTRLIAVQVYWADGNDLGE